MVARIKAEPINLPSGAVDTALPGRKPCLMKIYFANDTSAYHSGSWAACHYIGSELRRAGHTIEIESDRTKIENDQIADADAVIVNGEGTIHHDRRRPIHLLTLLRLAQSLGKYTAIYNASWAAMTNDFDDVLRGLDEFVVREIASHRELVTKHGITPTLRLDAAFWCEVSVPERPRTLDAVVTDFFSNEFQTFVRVGEGRLAERRFLDMRAQSWQETIDIAASARVIMTGRYHGIYAACKARTPFVAYPGNTHKMQGLLEWSGCPIAVAASPGDILQLSRAASRTPAVFDRFFDWMEQQPVWSPRL